MANYNYDFWSKEYEYAPGGANVQRMVGKSVDSTLAERRLMEDRAAQRKDRELKRNILNYNYAQKMASEMDDLNIVPTTGVRGMDEIMTAAGRQIADQAAYLNSELKRTGDYDSYSQAMARLKSDVTNVKNMDKGAAEFLGLVNTAMENGTFSDYNSANLLGIAEDMRRGSPKGHFENINGLTTWVSETVDGKPYSIAASEFGELGKKIQSKDDVDTILKTSINLNKGANGNIIGFDADPAGFGGQGLSGADLAYNSLTDIINQAGPGNKERKSAALLVDHFGIPRDSAKELFLQVIDEDRLTPQEKADGVITEGDRLLQQKWLDKARGMYGINQKAVNVEKRAQQTQFETYKDRIDNRKDVESTISNMPDATINNKDENDPLSQQYMFKEDMVNNPGKFFSNVQTSLIEKGFNNPKPIYSEPTIDAAGNVIPSRFLGFDIVNEKLPQSRRTPVRLLLEDFNNMDNVYKKMYAATGMESFSREAIPAGMKTGTNDPLTEMQGIGQAQINNDFAN